MGCSGDALLLLEQLDRWLNVFAIKTRHYALMSYSTKQMDMNQLFLWKFFCGSLILTFSVAVPVMWMPWNGFTLDGREHPSPLLYVAVATGLLSSFSFFIATFHLFRALDTNKRFVVRRKIHVFSWEMCDWVLYEISTTATVAVFFIFWFIEMPASSISIHILRIEAVLVQFVVTCVDFFFTTPQFRSNHVLLALLWPSLWIWIQLMWILCGHQPSSELLNFHTWHAPLFAVTLLLVTMGAFFAMQKLARRLRAQPSSMDNNSISKSKMALGATATGGGGGGVFIDTQMEITPHRSGAISLSATAKYDLMAKSQRATHSPLRESSIQSSNSDLEGGVFRIGSDASHSSSDDDGGHHVIAMGSWVGEPPFSNHFSQHLQGRATNTKNVRRHR